MPPSIRRRAPSNTERQSFAVYDNDQLTKAAEYDNVILAWRNGAPVRVRDIGRAIDGPENRFWARWQNGKRGILLVVFKQPGANVIDTVERSRPRCRIWKRRSRRRSMSASSWTAR